MGIFFPLPDKKIDLSYSYNVKWTGDGIEYVGGDAYNYQMEASLKAGWVSGVMALKAIFISAGAIILTVGVNSYVQTNEILQSSTVQIRNTTNASEKQNVSIAASQNNTVSDWSKEWGILTKLKTKDDTKSGWVCPKCNEFNKSIDRVCKNCGHEK